MDETMTIWYEVTNKKYAETLRAAADQLEKTGYAKLYLENVTIPSDGSVNDPTQDKSTWGGCASGGSWPTGAAGAAGGGGGGGGAGGSPSEGAAGGNGKATWGGAGGF